MNPAYNIESWTAIKKVEYRDPVWFQDFESDGESQRWLWGSLLVPVVCLSRNKSIVSRKAYCHDVILLDCWLAVLLYSILYSGITNNRQKYVYLLYRTVTLLPVATKQKKKRWRRRRTSISSASSLWTGAIALFILVASSQRGPWTSPIFSFPATTASNARARVVSAKHKKNKKE